ncbi:MAG: hypothetical protein JO015_08230 [Verrucomicrobia bacterium]|nr:hypothetical protein [Verrucomicrobiota bacterium]
MAVYYLHGPETAGTTCEVNPKVIFFEETRRFKIAAEALGIKFSVSRVRVRCRGGKARKPPYFACCYNVGNLGSVNIVAFFYPLLADWELMDKDAEGYRQRIRSALREEMIHAVQVMAVRDRYLSSPELRERFKTAEAYYERLLGRIIDELAINQEGHDAVLTAARLYYEDWTIDSLDKLRQTDKRLHGRDGYMASELIRQLAQIRCGELTSEEAKGKAWDRYRQFSTGPFGTTENLLKSMAATLRQAAPALVSLSPALAETLAEIERTICTLRQVDAARCGTEQKPLAATALVS